jgi:hypothetical protein
MERNNIFAKNFGRPSQAHCFWRGTWKYAPLPPLVHLLFNLLH